MKVFIPESIPSFNRGESAIFLGMQEALRVLDDVVEYTIYSENVPEDRENLGSKHEYITEALVRGEGGLWAPWSHLGFLATAKVAPGLNARLFKGGVWRAYRESDMVVMGHDNSLTKRHLVLIHFLKAQDIFVAVYCTSIVSRAYSRRWARWLLKVSLDRCDLVTTREPLSCDYLRELGVQATTCADQAFLMKPAAPSRAREILKAEGIDLGDRPMVVIVPARGTSVVFIGLRHIEDPEERYAFMREEMAHMADRIVEETGAVVVFVPHTLGEGLLDDRAVALDIADQCAHQDSIHVVRGDYRAPEYKAIFGLAEMVIGQRTHGLIGAASMETPFVCMTFPDDRRTQGILGKSVQLDEAIFNMETLTRDTLYQAFSRTWSRRKEQREHLHRRIPVVKDLARSGGSLLKDRFLSRRRR